MKKDVVILHTHITELIAELQELVDEYKYTNEDGMYENLISFIDIKTTELVKT